uniref:Helicase ATP-binding domain-containing protein n=1 Tax=viral metagenome TaxID=1070528 RepID=A0A6C0EPU8_9ZZZZ
MNSSKTKGYKGIQQELINREKTCNDISVYEYERPNKNPYEYEDVDKFKKDNNFDESKNCKLLIPDVSYKKDKYGRYYKDVYTPKRCDKADGFWVGQTINRHNTFDKGNCWVDKVDAECGMLLKSNKFLREKNYKNGSITKKNIKDAKKICEVNPECSFKQINEFTRDCISKEKLMEVHKDDEKYKKKSSKFFSPNAGIDINNLEKSLYDFYNSKEAPETLELIGKGNRCNPDADDDSSNDDNISLSKSIEVIQKDDYLSKHKTNYIEYVQYIIIELTPSYEKERILLYLDDPNEYDLFKLDYDIYYSELRKKIVLGKKYEEDERYSHIYKLYYKYFSNYFKISKNKDEVVELNKKIYYLYLIYFIINLNPNIKKDEDIIIKLLNNPGSFITFKLDYNNSLKDKSDDKDKLHKLYRGYFEKYFNEELTYYYNNTLADIYDKYVPIMITKLDPNNESDIIGLMRHIYDKNKFEEFRDNYNKCVEQKEFDFLYYTYFPTYFNYYNTDIIKEHYLYLQNIIRIYDPNIKEEYNELKKYVKNEKLLLEYKKYYNLHNEDDNAMNRIYEIYFPDFFVNTDKSSSFIISSNISSSSKSVSSSSKNKINKPPTVPQSIVNNICKLIVSNDSSKRGMLLWHSTGSGKTCTASAIIDGFWDSGKEIIYCSTIPALSSNPPHEFMKCLMNLYPRFYNKSLEQITKEFNAKNIRFLTFAKLANRIINRSIDINKCVLIIDEVHNLFRPLQTQQKQHAFLEKLLLSSKNPQLKVFILTATLGDNPSEIMKLLNIVKDIDTPTINYDDINQPDLFKEKTRGLISYFDMSGDTSKFPVVINNEPQYISMSTKQFEKYITAYKEVKETAKNYDKLSKANALNKYWAAARRYSNMLFNYEKGLSLHDFSAKLDRLLTTVTDDKYSQQKQYIYSAFYENRGYGGHGILAIAKELDKLGYEKLTPREAVKIFNNPKESNKKLRYILAITTQLSNDKDKDMSELRQLYNAPFNKNGEYVKLFLASQSYNEGLDLKAVRHIHIFEPLITWASDKQTIGRAARLCSHADLNKKDWDVSIHRYISDLPQIINDPVANLDKITEIENKIAEIEATINTNKDALKINKAKIAANKKLLTKLKKNKEANRSQIIALENENEYYSSNLEIGDDEQNKTMLKTLKAELKILNQGKKVGKNTKKQTLDATGVENIDEYIYKQSIEKMKNILTLYQLMQEVAVDCLVLNDFHKNGNNIIQCHNFN